MFTREKNPKSKEDAPLRHVQEMEEADGVQVSKVPHSSATQGRKISASFVNSECEKMLLTGTTASHIFSPQFLTSQFNCAALFQP